jgi:predicted porin
MNVFDAGGQLSAFGFTVGARGFIGNSNVTGGHVPVFPDRANFRRDDRNSSLISVGASYTIDAITVGVQAARVDTAGNQTFGTGGRREQAINAGLTYRIAPGLEAIAEYTYLERKERGFDFVTGGTGSTVGFAPGAAAGASTNNRVRANVVLAGLRLQF